MVRPRRLMKFSSMMDVVSHFIRRGFALRYVKELTITVLTRIFPTHSADLKLSLRALNKYG